ncbi:ribonuclease H-like protein [Amanita rubescens]|nr:ribonuclease H-like protein [Amanita rubescens]
MAEAPTSTAPVKRLFAADSPLVWVDCEMTGLAPGKDKLLEIAVIVTDGDLQCVDDGISLTIHREKDVLDNMDPWCIKQHGSTGLTQACLESPHNVKNVASQVLSYIKQRIPEEKVAYLAGSSVHQDRAFLFHEMPEILEWLHYRIVDVSTIKVLANHWIPQHAYTHKAESDHRALSDILGSIRELQSYRENIFLNNENDQESKEEKTQETRGVKRKHGQ